MKARSSRGTPNSRSCSKSPAWNFPVATTAASGWASMTRPRASRTAASTTTPGCCTTAHGFWFSNTDRLQERKIMADTKKVAVVVRDRQGEALRVAGGLTLADDVIEVFVLDRKLDKNDPDIVKPLELVSDLELKIYSNNPENGYTTITLEEMAKKLLEYDHVVAY